LKTLVAIAALVLLSVAVPQAQAIPLTTSISFDGTCTDCTGHGLGTLLVTGFVPGNQFTLNSGNFVSFTYQGSNLQSPFVINTSNVTTVAGTLGPNFPGPFNVQIVSLTLQVEFQSFSDGTWQIFNPTLNDFGAASSFDTAGVPEPETIVLTGIGILALGLGRKYFA
jgi:hypothetical protein